MRTVALTLCAVASLSGAAAPETFTGVITDSECAGSHARMRMGPTDADCTKACIDAHGASYVLYDGTRAYGLSDQRAPQAFAGRRVTVVGILDDAGKVIRVDSITATPEAERDRASAEGLDRSVTRRAGVGPREQ